MRNISVFAVAVALIAMGIGAWVTSSALVAPSILEQMLNGKKQSGDHTFVSIERS
jgi:hypothetical protein